MLKLALIFFVVSLLGGFFGFSGISAANAGIAKVFFFIAVGLFLMFVLAAFVAGQMILWA